MARSLSHTFDRGGRWQPYLLALLLVALALAATLSLQHLYVTRPPLFAFFAAIAVAAWLEGRGPGLFAAALSIPSGLYFYVAARPDHILHSRDALLSLFFAVCAFAGAALYGHRRRTEASLHHAHDALQTKADELERANAALTGEMAARRQSEAALERLREDLARASRLAAMSETAAAIAHEINQPLAAAATNADACVRWLDVADLDEARGAAQRAAREAARAGAVVQRIRSAVKRALTLPAPIAITTILDEVLSLLHGEIARHRVAVAVTVDPALPPVTGDRVQLQQVFVNLLGNALDSLARVEDRPRQVWITAAAAGQTLTISVRDNGEGFADGLQERLFAPFVTTKAGGMGMGLAICRSIVEAHGGTLTAAPAPGGGAEFIITLPPANGGGHD